MATSCEQHASSLEKRDQQHTSILTPVNRNGVPARRDEAKASEPPAAGITESEQASWAVVVGKW